MLEAVLREIVGIPIKSFAIENFISGFHVRSNAHFM